MTTAASNQPTRTLYYGDNLEVLRNKQWFPDECVDLVYLDPPFKSGQDYNLLFKTARGTPATAQVQAFTDTWKWDTAAMAAYEQLVSDPLVPGRVGQMVEAFYKFLGGSEMMAYLVMMTPRLLELHRVLKPTGSLYLHCDPAASHYLKLVLDTVFGPTNFRNEIVWKRTSAHGDTRQGAKHFGRIHDVILRYSKTSSTFWQQQYGPYDEEYIDTFYRFVEPGRAAGIDLATLLPADQVGIPSTNGKGYAHIGVATGHIRGKIWRNSSRKAGSSTQKVGSRRTSAISTKCPACLCRTFGTISHLH